MSKEPPSENPGSSKRKGEPVVASGLGQQSQNKSMSQVAIMVRANKKWSAAGMPKGDTDHFWLEAEQELRQEAAEQTEQQGGA